MEIRLDCTRKTHKEEVHVLRSSLVSTVIITITIFVPHVCSFSYLITHQGSVNERYVVHIDDFVLTVVIQ